MKHIGQNQKEISKLQVQLEQKDKMIEDLQQFPNKKELNKSVLDFLNAETIEQSVQRILKDDSEVAFKFKGTDVSSVLQQISGKKPTLLVRTI